MMSIPFSISLSFFLGAIFAAFVSKLGYRIALIDNPNERSSHSHPTPRGGGIGIWIAFILIGVFSIKDIFFSAVGGAAGLLGFFEDRFTLSSRLRLIIQLALSASVVYLFLGSPTSIIAISLFLFWVIFITGTTNFYNFMDGINGIAGLTGAVGFGLMAFFSFYIVADSDIAIMSIVIAAACLGFLPFNFPRAKVFMGDVGSIFLGLMFALFVVKLSININILLCLTMFLCTFYADALMTIFYRWKRGERLMEAHRHHLYQYMSNELGLPHWLVTVIYAIVQLVFGLFAISTYSKGLIWQLVILITFGIVFLISYKIIKNMNPLTPEIGYRHVK